MPGCSIIGRNELISIIEMRLHKLSDAALMDLFNANLAELGDDGETDSVIRYGNDDRLMISSNKKTES